MAVVQQGHVPVPPLRAYSPRCPAPPTGRRPGLQRAAKAATSSLGNSPPSSRGSAAGSLTGYAAVSSTPPRAPSPRGQDVFQQRPQTHCGASQRPVEEGDDDSLDAEPECSAAGKIARELAGNCSSCMKLRLRLEHAERARVKAQEQLAALHGENLRLRSQLRNPSTGAEQAKQGEEELEGGMPATASTPRRIRPDTPKGLRSPDQDALSTGSAAASSPAGLDAAGRDLEGYRREVELLRDALKERDKREATFAEQLRKQQEEQEVARQEWQIQLAGLVCEVQDLEARNQALRSSLQDSRFSATPSAMAESTTTASGRGGGSTAMSGASSEAGPSRSPSCCDDSVLT